MATYSKSSKDKLITAHIDLQLIFNEVIKIIDNTIVFGYRDPQIQFELFKKGRTLIEGVWVVTNKREVVTNCDGIKIKSRHNSYPSEAVDAVPYPIDWMDIDRMILLAECVLETASKLKEEGKITHHIEWGGNWTKFKDYPHYQIKR